MPLSLLWDLCDFKQKQVELTTFSWPAQAVGSPVGAFLVQHLEPHRLQFAIASALLLVFLLMAFPPLAVIKYWRDRRLMKKFDAENGDLKARLLDDGAL